MIVSRTLCILPGSSWVSKHQNDSVVQLDTWRISCSYAVVSNVVVWISKQTIELNLINHSAPSAIGMYGLALGISRVGNSLPGPVYALLTGLNSATVGIIALAAVQLARRAITDPLTRLLVFFGGVAGMLYTALWYFPIILVCAGSATIIWDYRWLHRGFRLIKQLLQRLRTRNETRPNIVMINGIDLERQYTASTLTNTLQIDLKEDDDSLKYGPHLPAPSVNVNLLSWRFGLFICLTFVLSFILLIILRSALHDPPRSFSLLSNFYLAGTIIFGGGPVVIPLLREYIVVPGFVSSRDFLLGVALIEAFPGPNFNIAVYLGALAVHDTSIPSYIGALIGFVGMFTPGMWLAIGSMGVWAKLRNKKWLKSCLRGIHAAAVGLVFTAVYRLWRVGLLDQNHQYGTELGQDPWWLAVSATAFVGGAWFRLEAPFAIALGGIMGLVWYGIVNK